MTSQLFSLNWHRLVMTCLSHHDIKYINDISIIISAMMIEFVSFYFANYSGCSSWFSQLSRPSIDSCQHCTAAQLSFSSDCVPRLTCSNGASSFSLAQLQEVPEEVDCFAAKWGISLALRLGHHKKSWLMLAYSNHLETQRLRLSICFGFPCFFSFFFSADTGWPLVFGSDDASSLLFNFIFISLGLSLSLKMFGLKRNSAGFGHWRTRARM